MTGHVWLPFLRNQLRAHQEPVYRTACPKCRAAVGKPCSSPSRRRLHQAHASRYEAAGLKPQVVTDADPQEAS